jgi:peptidoglycan/LPS O-acetylase OafA/YrhL
VSYGIYLLNVPVVSATRMILGAEASAALVFVVAASASVAVATIVHRCVERLFLALRDRLRDGFVRKFS